MARRLTIASALFELAVRAWDSDGWSVHYYLQPNRRDANLLATLDEEKKICHIYPHPVNIPVEKTGLHEMIHNLFDLDGEDKNEQYVYMMEDWLFQRLGKKQHRVLHDIFVKPLTAS